MKIKPDFIRMMITGSRYSGTAWLLVACAVKADDTSGPQLLLKKPGNLFEQHKPQYELCHRYGKDDGRLRSQSPGAADNLNKSFHEHAALPKKV